MAVSCQPSAVSPLKGRLEGLGTELFVVPEARRPADVPPRADS